MLRVGTPCFLVLLVGCAVPSSGDGGFVDVGVGASVFDGGALRDGGVDSGVDGGVIDSGFIDAGVLDAGIDAGNLRCWQDADCPPDYRCDRQLVDCPAFDSTVIQTGGQCRFQPCASADCSGAACTNNTECNWDYTCAPYGLGCRPAKICLIVIVCPANCPEYLGPNDSCPRCICERCL